MDLSRRQLLALSGGVVLAAGARAEAAGMPVTIPALRTWRPASGGFRYDGSTRIAVRDRALADVADVLADDLTRQVRRLNKRRPWRLAWETNRKLVPSTRCARPGRGRRNHPPVGGRITTRCARRPCVR